MVYRPLLWLAAAMAAGISADRVLFPEGSPGALAGWWLASAAAVGGALRARRRGLHGGLLGGVRGGRLAEFLTLAAVASLGGSWHYWQWNVAPGGDLGRYVGDEPAPACVEAVLVEPIRVAPPASGNPLRALPAEEMSEATLRLARIRDGEEWRVAAGECRLRIRGAWREAVVGDTLHIFARMGIQPAPLNPGQRDWREFERANGRRSELYVPDPGCVTIVERAAWWSPGAALDRARQYCERSLAAYVGKRDEPLALAVMLGARDKLDDATITAFLETGAIHFLVVSGSNLAMLAGIVWTLSRWAGLSVRGQQLATVTSAVAYTALVGAEPPMVRATILAAAAAASLTFGRRGTAGNLLGGAGLAVMALGPSEIFRGGTQLSFLSVGVLSLVAQRLSRRRPSDPLDRLLREAESWPMKLARIVGWTAVAMIAASLAVWLATTPLAGRQFHIVTPAAVLITPLIWPLIGVALAATFGALAFGAVTPAIGHVLGTVCGECLHGADAIVKWAQGFSGSHFYTAGPAGWWLAGCYGAAAAWVLVPRWRPRWQWQVSAALLWAAAGYGLAGAGRVKPDELRCTFLAVGHGTCAVLELPSGQTVMYDAGSLGSPEQAAETIAAFLWSRGISRIDQLVLSHADVDHYNAVPGLVERFDIGVVYWSPLMFDPISNEGRLEAGQYLREYLQSQDTPTRFVWSGDRLPTVDDETTLEVLHPPRDGVAGRDNANSILLSVEYAGRRLLLPGDLEGAGIELVMTDPPLDCDVLLAPHHGSEQSDPPGFAAWCSPEEVVMSGRRPTRTLASMASYEESGARVWHTAYSGAVTCLIRPAVVPEISPFQFIENRSR